MRGSAQRHRLAPGKGGEGVALTGGSGGESAPSIRRHEPLRRAVSTQTPEAQTLRIKRSLERRPQTQTLRGTSSTVWGRDAWPPRGRRTGRAEPADTWAPEQAADTRRPRGVPGIWPRARCPAASRANGPNVHINLPGLCSPHKTPRGSISGPRRRAPVGPAAGPRVLQRGTERGRARGPEAKPTPLSQAVMSKAKAEVTASSSGLL